MPRSSPSPALPSLLASLHTQSRSQGRGPRCSCQGPVGDKGPAQLPAGCRAALGSNRFEFKSHPSIFAPINVFILCLRMNKWGSAFPSCSLLLLAPPVTVQQVQSCGGGSPVLAAPAKASPQCSRTHALPIPQTRRNVSCCK